MIHAKIQLLLVSLLLVTTLSGFGQTRSRQPRGKQSSPSAIRRVDFLNFAYRPNLCNQEFGNLGIGTVVRVRRGEFKNADVYYGVVEDKVTYGQLTGDNREVAIVHIGCGETLANFGLSELFVYAMQNGQASLLASLNDRDIEHGYDRYYRDDPLWRITDPGVRVADGNLIIERFADGSHACPTSIVTFEYRWDGRQLLLNKRPLKRSSKLAC